LYSKIITACTVGGLNFILEAGFAAPGALEQRPHPAYVVQDQNLFILNVPSIETDQAERGVISWVFIEY
jgi:hypothetical protein